MAGGKSEGSTNPSAVRIRDNQRRSRARHKEYVEALQQKVQDFERRGVEATLEMQQAARNVAVENSRLRMLLGYHGVSSSEVDKFLQTFPDQANSDAAKATISQAGANQLPIAAGASKIPIQPLARPPSPGPSTQTYPVPSITREGSSTREVLDAIVGIRREPRPSDSSTSSINPTPISSEQRLPLLPRPQPPILPALPALVLGQARPDPNPIDRLSVLASASVQQDADVKHHRALSITDSLHVPSPPGVGQSPPSSAAGTPARLSSASPRSYGRRSRSPLDRSTTPRQDSAGESSRASVASEAQDAIPSRKPTIPHILDTP